MKILIVFFLSISFNTVVAQSQQDTVNMLQAKAKFYLTEMYDKHNFHTAFKMWGNRMVHEAKNLYKVTDKSVTNDSLFFRQVNNDFRKHFANYTGFKLIEIHKESLNYKNKTIDYTISYMYTEIYKKKSHESFAMFTFSYDYSLNEWKVIDSRALSVILEVTKK